MLRYRSLGWLVCGLLLLSACPKRLPTKSYQSAIDAIKRARLAMADKCAKGELKSAQKMMAQARKAMDAGKYDEARTQFEAARELAEKARKESLLNREDCLKRLRGNKKPSGNNIAPPPSIVASRETPQIDTREKLTTIYFGFNQYNLTAESRNTLQGHARWLEKRPNTKIEISGHCDARGSVEYNLALGERRAIAVRTFLVRLGIARNRISIVSYGHQRPAKYGNTADAHQKNRRAEFRVVK